MAGEDGNVQGFLDGIQSKNTGPQLSVADFAEYQPQDLSPDQQEAFANKQYWQRNPPLEQLNQSDYYPGMNDPIAKGTYSGPQIGSLTLFAPGGGIAPVAMNDARERALAGAAAKKSAEIDDFYKSIKAPETKLKAVQPELQKGFYGWMGKYIQDAKKQHGDGAYDVLKNDVNFQEGIQRWNTVAQYNTEIANDVVKFEESLAKGDIAAPEAIESWKNVKQGYEGMQDPNDPKARDLVKNWGKMRAYTSISDNINDVLEKSIAEQTDMLKIGSGDFYDILKTQKETYYPAEKIKAMATSIYQQRYADDPTGYFTVEKIEDELNSKLSKKIDLTVQIVTRPNPPAGRGETDYSDQDYQENFQINYDPTGDTKGNTQRAINMEVSVPLKQNDATKTIRVSDNMKIIPMSGGKKTGESFTEGKVYATGVVKVYKKGTKVMAKQPDGTKKLTDVSGEIVPSELEGGVDPNPKHFDYVAGNIITAVDKKGNIDQKKQYFVPTEYSKNTFNVKDKRQGEIDASDVMTDMETRASQMNTDKEKSAKKPVAKNDFNEKWASLKSGETLVGPDGKTYKKK